MSKGSSGTCAAGWDGFAGDGEDEGFGVFFSVAMGLWGGKCHVWRANRDTEGSI